VEAVVGWEELGGEASVKKEVIVEVMAEVVEGGNNVVGGEEDGGSGAGVGP